MSTNIYCTTFCNHGHDVTDGAPIEHECYVLDVAKLRQEYLGEMPEGPMHKGRVHPGKPHPLPLCASCEVGRVVSGDYTYRQKGRKTVRVDLPPKCDWCGAVTVPPKTARKK